jgi:hypothetical protein
MPQAKQDNQSKNPLTEGKLETLLSKQTSVILEAVDERLAAQDKRIEERLAAQEIRSLSVVDKRLEKLEERFMQKLNDLTITLEKFLKRTTDLEEEFEFMKADLKRIKAVLRERLGVTLD